MSIAIIDLGTNTFNLLIAEMNGEGRLKVLVSTREPVKLGEGGITRKYIAEPAFRRGIEAVARHMQRINEYHVGRIVTFATSAIRDAENGAHFVHSLREKFGLEPMVISGDKEADLIYQGVKQTIPFTGMRYLILDIGGGSNEFIIAGDEGILWKRSFRLGMARLLEMFTFSDPFEPEEILKIEMYLQEQLEELFEYVLLYKPGALVGASGAFDSFVELLALQGDQDADPQRAFNHISLERFANLHQKLIHSTRNDRGRMPGLEPVRRDMVVLASLFVNFILHKTGLVTIYQSAYSLKEGAAFEVMVNKL